MLLTLEKICEHAGRNLAQRCFVEGERVLQAGHVIKCGKYNQTGNSSDTHIKAFCLQTI